MAGSKGGKGGGVAQSIFGPRGGGGGGGFFGGGGGGGFLDRLRGGFPQQPQQFQPFGQQPVGETFAPPGQPGPAGPQQQPQFAPPGQPILRQSPPQPGLPPGVQQLGPGAIINDRFGGPQPGQQGPPGVQPFNDPRLAPQPSQPNPAEVQRFGRQPIGETFRPTGPTPPALMQSPRSPLGPLVDPRGRRKDFAF